MKYKTQAISSIGRVGSGVAASEGVESSRVGMEGGPDSTTGLLWAKPPGQKSEVIVGVSVRPPGTAGFRSILKEGSTRSRRADRCMCLHGRRVKLEGLPRAWKFPSLDGRICLRPNEESETEHQLWQKTCKRGIWEANAWPAT